MMARPVKPIRLVAAVCIAACILGGCGSSGKTDNSKVAESYVADRFKQDIAAAPGASAVVGGDYKQITVSCGTKGQPDGTYGCTATWGYAEALKQEWTVQVTDGKVTSADRTSSAVETATPGDAQP